MYLLNLTTCPATTCYLQQSCITQEQPISGLCSLKISPSCCWLSSSILVSYQNTKHTVCGSPARATDSRGKKSSGGGVHDSGGCPRGRLLVRVYGYTVGYCCRWPAASVPATPLNVRNHHRLLRCRTYRTLCPSCAPPWLELYRLDWFAK